MTWHHATRPEAFDARYRSNPDPWNFRFSRYEQDRYQKILSALSSPNYRHAYEPGCSVGELTRLLAGRCERVTATDVSPAALSTARERCHENSNVTFIQESLSDPVPTRRFDLIVMSEIAYYFAEHELIRIARNLEAALILQGELLAAHWLGESADHALHGDEAHRLLMESLSLEHRTSRRFEGFRVDTWIKS